MEGGATVISVDGGVVNGGVGVAGDVRTLDCHGAREKRTPNR